jgi:hypothetical protein
LNFLHYLWPGPQGPKLREAGELAERVDALERQLAGEDEGADQRGDEADEEEAGDQARPEVELGAGI